MRIQSSMPRFQYAAGAIDDERAHLLEDQSSLFHLHLHDIWTIGICSDMAPPRENTSVIIVGGGGTIGASTALHLVRAGYKPSNVTVIDTYPIPSAQSAGNDLNKILGIWLSNPEDLQLSLEARQMWNEDELFKPFFHKTGQVSGLPKTESQEETLRTDCVQLECANGDRSIADLRLAYQKIVDAGLGDTHEWLDSEDQILMKARVLDRERMKVSIALKSRSHF